jgi:hypothetical protein
MSTPMKILLPLLALAMNASVPHPSRQVLHHPVIRQIHPFFVGVIEVEYLPAENGLGIACKIFSDDLENTLKKQTGQQVDIIKGAKDRNKALLETYFSKHLHIRADGKAVPLNMLGYENDQEATLVFLEAKNTGRPAKLEIETDLLYDYEKRQTNLVHYIVDGKRNSHRLNYPETTARFTTN